MKVGSELRDLLGTGGPDPKVSEGSKFDFRSFLASEGMV
jgi:hypothetical protein